VTTVACPTCGEAAVFGPENRWRPFCSERCRLIDLGAWATESYRIPAKPDESESEGEEPKPDAE
jgi:endogenous inhibitor of DNA gyrase (YacG/DUF329 family)